MESIQTGKIIGEKFKKYVVDEINQRQIAHGSGTDTDRTPDQLHYLNSKTSFVRMASGVYIEEARINEEEFRLENVNMALARHYVLSGGVSRLSDEKGTHPLQQRSTGDTPTTLDTGVFGVHPQKNDSNFPNQPMPGIESVNIQHQNRGSIVKATVKMKAHSPEQLQMIDILYLRLGYIVFLEWGNSLYLSDTGALKRMGTTLIEDPKGFFAESHMDFNEFQQKIEYTRAEHHGNYDGMLAKIVNFSWEFQTDGTYDITLNLISTGDIIESLKINTTPDKKDAEDVIRLLGDSKNNSTIQTDNILSVHLATWRLYDQADKSKKPPTISITIGGGEKFPVGHIIQDDGTRRFHKLEWDIPFPTKSEAVKWLYDQYPGKFTPNDEVFLASSFGELMSNKSIYQVYEKIFGEVLLSYQVTYDTSIDINNPTSINPVINIQYSQDNEGGENNTSNNLGYYMKFEYLLDYIDTKLIPTTKTKRNPMCRISTAPTTRMHREPYQTSYDPRVCIVDSNVEDVNTKKYFPELNSWNTNTDGSFAHTMGIYISFDTIQSAIDSNLDKKGNLSLFNFLKGICDELNKALGGVNNLEPIMDGNTIYIIDGNYSIVDKHDYQLELYGYNGNTSNFVRNMSIKTEIPPDFATMATIGSTAGGYVKGTENTMFSKWNKGLIDRFKEEYVTPSNIDGSETKDQATKDYADQIYYKFGYEPFGYSKGGSGISLNTETIEKNIATATEHFKYLSSYIQSQDEKYASSHTGFIPISLGVTMDGISGIKIFQAINVGTKFLPPNYPKNLQFIIKGVNHKISDQDWETSLETVTIYKSEI